MTSAVRTRATEGRLHAGHAAGGCPDGGPGRSVSLPARRVIRMECMPGDPGEHECIPRRGMLRGRNLVEVA